jgi:hypothetical protein
LEENAASSSNREISHMVEIIVRHVDRSKGHISANELLRDSGIRKVQGQNNLGGCWEEGSKAACVSKTVFPNPSSLDELQK